MYMASLNSDRFFKRVFSDLKIAKAFLEDVFDLKIDEITALTTEHRVTNESAVVEFDFRCKINGAYVIVDMQQWYKPDVIHRFYMYHSVSTALQLEKLPLKSIIVNPQTQEEEQIKDYRRIDPVITLVWMVDDTLQCEGDFLSYSMTQQTTIDFIRNENIWSRKDITEILEQRDAVIKAMENKTKNLDFIPQNKLVFAFQKNIIKNPKHEPYFKWFEFAELSKNKDNTQADFKKFEKDEPFKETYIGLKQRLSTALLSREDKEYIVDEAEKAMLRKRTKDGLREEFLSDRHGEVEEAVEKAVEEAIREERSQKEEAQRREEEAQCRIAELEAQISAKKTG